MYLFLTIKQQQQADSDSMQEMIEINNIQKSSKEQEFKLDALKISDLLIWKKKFKLNKLKILNNHGSSHYNRFYSFYLFGVKM